MVLTLFKAVLPVFYGTSVFPVAARNLFFQSVLPSDLLGFPAPLFHKLLHNFNVDKNVKNKKKLIHIL